MLKRLFLVVIGVFYLFKTFGQNDFFRPDSGKSIIKSYNVNKRLGIEVLRQSIITDFPLGREYFNDSAEMFIASPKNQRSLWIGKKHGGKIKWFGFQPDEFNVRKTLRVNIMNLADEKLALSLPPDSLDFHQNNPYAFHMKPESVFGVDSLSMENYLEMKPLIANSSKKTPEILHVKTGSPPYLKLTRVLLPSIYRLDSFISYVGDQRGFNTCSAWAVSSLKSIDENMIRGRIFKGKRNQSNYFYSPSFIFSKAKEQHPNITCHSGIDLSVAMDVLHQFGTTPYDFCPYYRSDIDCDIDLKPTMLKAALRNKIDYPVWVEIKLIEFQLAISHNCPIAVEVWIDDDFKSKGYQSGFDKSEFIWNNYFGSKDKSKRTAHSMVCVGYDDNKKAFLVLNSFGEAFGSSGLFWIDYDFMIDACRQAVRLDSQLFNYKIDEERRKIELLKNTQRLQSDPIALAKESSAKSYGLKFLCTDIVFVNNKESVHFEIYNSENAIIRQDLVLAPGYSKYFFYKNILYTVELLNTMRPSKGTLLGVFDTPGKVDIRVSKFNELSGLTRLMK